MRTNGFLRYPISISGDGLDENGEPTESSVEWSEPFPCLIQFVVNTKATYQDGDYSQISLKIVSEAIPPSVSLLKIEREGEYLGEFSVRGKPIKTTMDRIILYV